MDDLIRRKDAIDQVCTMMKECFDADEEELDAIATTISELPPAQSKQKTGEWIQNDIAEKLGIWLCSECEQPINLVNEWGELQKLNYCPNCGAKMEGEI